MKHAATRNEHRSRKERVDLRVGRAMTRPVLGARSRRAVRAAGIPRGHPLVRALDDHAKDDSRGSGLVLNTRTKRSNH
jgi:hypothetical protein